MERKSVNEDSFLKNVAKLLSFDLEQLASSRRGSALTHQRYLVAYVGIQRWRQSATKLAVLLGRHPDIISRWARKGAELRKQNDTFASEVEKLDLSLVDLAEDD